MAGFIVECTVPNDKFDYKSDGKLEQAKTLEIEFELVWMFHVNGASNTQGSGVGLILTNSERIVTKYVLRINFKASNNQVEHEALLADLKIA